MCQLIRVEMQRHLSWLTFQFNLHGGIMSYSKQQRTFGARSLRLVVQTAIAALLPIAAWAGPVDINKADAPTLAKELTGVGMAKAKTIVEYREKNGAFHTADDLAKVKGVGPKLVERNRANIRLDKVVAEAPKKP
jgi:competence protein ComEA